FALGSGCGVGLIVLVKHVRATGEYPGLLGSLVAIATFLLIGLAFIGANLDIVHPHHPGEADRIEPMVPIDSVSCMSEDDESTVEVAMGRGGKGAYRLEIDLFDFSPPTLIDRRVRDVALGEPAMERVVYRKAELESLLAEKLPRSRSGVDTLDVYVI